jgi:4-hydroxythreonine-4-phosphate dehydrogenase
VILDLPVLALTPGEPTGVGPECVARFATLHPRHRLLLVADPDLMNETAESLQLPSRFTRWSPGTEILAGKPACLPLKLAAPAAPGRPDPVNADYVLESIRLAVGLVRSGRAGAMVTGPIHKAVINESGIPFSGHTEFLAELAGVNRVVMMLATQDLRVALVTTHLPLRDVADAITRQGVEETVAITCEALRSRFGIDKPVVQVLGLNPHAGEGGHLGTEDAAVIAPAIAHCRESGLKALGPVPADTAFTPSALAACDAVVAMYHDQGLPVLKHAGFGKAVNITLGLPFIRTSVDHGTALDIAGQGRANPDSLAAAVRMAERMCRQGLGAAGPV